MKKLLALFCCIALFKSAIAQRDSLAFDDHGKYIYYKVVNVGTNTADVLYGRALGFLKGYDKSILKVALQDAKAGNIVADGYIMVAKTGSLAKHDDGRITCKLNIGIKDTKYRYWFTNFVYTPYHLDRYNNYVPEIGLDVEMEAGPKKLDPKDVNHYLDECGKFSKQIGARLQQYMLAAPKVKTDTVAKKVIKIDKW